MDYTKPRKYWIEIDPVTSNPTGEICWAYYADDKPLEGNWLLVQECEVPTLKNIQDLLKVKVKTLTRWSDEKVNAWFETDNPNFGECSANELIARGRAHKVEKFIDSAIEENGWKEYNEENE